MSIRLEELPYLGNGNAERAPELFFAKYGIVPGTIAEIGNVYIPGVLPDLCVDLLEGPVMEDARYFVPSDKYDNVISISTVEHFGMGDEFDWRGPLEGLRNLVNWVKPGGFFYVTVPFGKPTPSLERKAGRYLAQFYPPMGVVTFMPFTRDYINDFRVEHSNWLKFMFLKRVDIARNRWAWCEEEDVIDCQMVDDGATAILIMSSKDLRKTDVESFPPVILDTPGAPSYRSLPERLYRVARSPRRWPEYAHKLLDKIKWKA